MSQLDDFLIVLLRAFALAVFLTLLVPAIKILASGSTDPELRRVRIAVGLLWLALSFVSAYAMLLWMGVPVGQTYEGVQVGSLAIALLNALAAGASLWAFRPWRAS